VIILKIFFNPEKIVTNGAPPSNTLHGCTRKKLGYFFKVKKIVEQHYFILTQFNKQNFLVHQAADFSRIF